MIKVASQQQMKEINTQSVFRIIREHANLSRAAIAKMTNLSPTTISTIVEQLINKGMVVERYPVERKGAGRKAISLEVNREQKYIIGMELDHSKLSGTVFNLKNEPILTLELRFECRSLDKETIVDAIIKLSRRLISSVSNRFDELMAICIGVPALLDSDKQLIVLSTALNIENVNLYEGLETAFTVPVLIENETLLAATVEKERFEKDTSPFIYLSINEGLGCGVIIDDQFLQGVNGVLLEIGHMSLDVNGPQCLCGNKGCFEMQVSITALVQRIKHRLADEPNSMLHHVLQSDSPRPIEVVLAEACEAQDKLAMQIVEETAAALGDGIVNLINIFNPEVIVIGGRLAALGDPLLNGVKAQVTSKAIKQFRERCSVRLAQVQHNAVAQGGSYYAVKKVLESHIH